MPDRELVVLRNRASDEAILSPHGAQLISWRPAGEKEQIYASPLSRPAAGKAFRGGIPVCFPQFSDRGPLPKHGFARTSRWQLLTRSPQQVEVAEATFQLDATTAGDWWGHGFHLQLSVRLASMSLELQLQASNTGSTAWNFTAALHTYLAVEDVRGVTLRGLQGLSYEDMVAGNQVRTEAAPALGVSGEVDRVYHGVVQPLELQGDLPLRRVLQQGFTDTVVWNPGPAKAAMLGDMPAQDWTRMLCIEAAVIEQPVHLAPGQAWRGMQRIELSR